LRPGAGLTASGAGFAGFAVPAPGDAGFAASPAVCARAVAAGQTKAELAARKLNAKQLAAENRTVAMTRLFIGVDQECGD
jgi:hypothetical protein